VLGLRRGAFKNLPSLGILSNLYGRADLADPFRSLEICRQIVRDIVQAESVSLPPADWEPLIDWMAHDPFLQQRIRRLVEGFLS
jgi:hypothetical protein